MITDPDEPGYRYPRPGERLWHHAWSGGWCVVLGQPDYGPSDDEVEVRCEGSGLQASVKLRNLEETP